MFRFPPRRILVLVDFSESSLPAFRAAEIAAERFGARLETVFCDAPLPMEMAIYGQAVRTRERRRRIEGELQRRFPGAASAHVARGDAANVVLRLARERNPDLIVVGSGPAADRVIKLSRKPVLVVNKTLRPLHRVLAPLQEDRDAQRGLVAAGLVARAFKAELDVLHVVTDPIFGADPEKLMSARLAQLPPDVLRDTKPKKETRLGDPVKEIVRATRGRDLMVVLSRPKSLFGDLVLGTTAQQLARHATIPLLAIPAPRRGGKIKE